MSDNQSKINQIALGFLAMGTALVAGGAATYTLHWKYGTPIRNPYWPQCSMVGLVCLMVSTFLFQTRYSRWIVLRNIVFATMGIMYPISMILFMLKNVLSRFITIGPQELTIFVASGMLINLTNSFLRSRDFPQVHKARIPIKQNPGHQPYNQTILHGSIDRTLLFRPTWKSLSRTMIFCLVLGIPLIIGGLWPHHDPVAVGLGCLFIIELLIIRFQFKVVITEHRISSTSFFSTHSLHLSEITGASWYDGWIVLQSPEDSVWINSNRYPPECRESILSLLLGPDHTKNS